MKIQINRQRVAVFLREMRRDCPFSQLKGNWTLREWNSKIRHSAYNYEASVARFERVNA